jgi:hypothetical protein
VWPLLLCNVDSAKMLYTVKMSGTAWTFVTCAASSHMCRQSCVESWLCCDAQTTKSRQHPPPLSLLVAGETRVAAEAKGKKGLAAVASGARQAGAGL